MARPKKAVAVLKAEGKSHRTKKELATREAAEKSLLTGKQMMETAEIKSNPIAHREFLRVRGLLKLIGKNDEIYGAATRRYCLNRSRLVDADEEVGRLRGELAELRDSRKADNGAVIPKTIANRIVDRIKDISPLFRDAEKFNIKGQVSIPYVDEANDNLTVAYATEFTDLEAKSTKLLSVDLTHMSTGCQGVSDGRRRK